MILGGSLLYYLIAFIFLPRPYVLVTATVTTERISFVTPVGRQSAFFLSNVRSAEDGPCIAGLLTPARDATVIYARRGEGALQIRIVAPPGKPGTAKPSAGHFDPASGGEPLLFGRQAYFQTCAAEEHTPPLRLPVWGDVTVGEEFRPDATPDDSAPRFLLGGLLKVSARAFSVLGMPPTLYEVSRLALPVGSSLRAKAPGATWWGVAYVDPNEPALTADLATDERNLALSSPRRGSADPITVSRLTRMTTDPNLVKLQVLFAIWVAFVGFMLTHMEKLHHSIAGLWRLISRSKGRHPPGGSGHDAADLPWETSDATRTTRR